MTRFRFFMLSVLILLFVIAASWEIFLHTAVITEKQGVIFTVQPGENFQSVTADLQKQNIITQPYYFNFLIYIKNYIHQLKSGEYFFPYKSTPEKILLQMVTGTGLFQHKLTIIAGWNFNQVREALNKNENLRHITQKLNSPAIMNLLGQANLKPEGLFFPDTYYFTRGTADIKLLKLAYKTMQDKLNKAWKNRASGLFYSNLYQALIAASLIEKEAHFNQERFIIAGVIENRLRINMLLQIDATVIYGMGANYKGKIFKKDLLADTIFNTYVHKGLPPTPIAMPSLESIYAAMHPDKNNFIYYVARGDGYHTFSITLVEQNNAILTAKKFKRTK